MSDCSEIEEMNVFINALHDDGFIDEKTYAQGFNLLKSLVQKIEALERNVEHLKLGKEFEISFQREVLDVGLKHMHTIDGKTYCVLQAWEAIKRALPEPKDKDNEKSCN